MYFKMVIAGLILTLLPIIASASCVYDGMEYSEETLIGPYICTDGEWVIGN